MLLIFKFKFSKTQIFGMYRLLVIVVLIIRIYTTAIIATTYWHYRRVVIN